MSITSFNRSGGLDLIHIFSHGHAYPLINFKYDAISNEALNSENFKDLQILKLAMKENIHSSKEFNCPESYQTFYNRQIEAIEKLEGEYPEKISKQYSSIDKVEEIIKKRMSERPVSKKSHGKWEATHENYARLQEDLPHCYPKCPLDNDSYEVVFDLSGKETKET